MALKRLGIPLEIVAYSEIDKFAIQAYKAIHGEDIPNLGDVKKIERLPECNLVVYGSPCLTGDTLVLTSEGYSELETIKPGTLVVGHDGKLHKVTAFLNQGMKPTYELKAMGMGSIHCTGNHKFYVRRMYYGYEHRGRVDKNGWKKKDKLRLFHEPEWVELKNLDKTYYLGMPVNNQSQLPERDGGEKELPLESPSFWYLVGRYLGNGWIKTTEEGNNNCSTAIICCGKQDIEELKAKITSYSYNLVEDRAAFRLQISNKELATFLSQFGCGVAKKIIPGFVIDLPKKLLKSFVQGYLESNGYYTQNRCKSSSRKLIYGMTQCIAKVYNRPFSIYHRKRKLEFAFHKQNKKQDKAFYEGGYIWYPIQSIIPTGLREPVYDITVEDCHSFIANNCITHNCTDFSSAGKQKGLSDEQGNQTRSGLLLEVERLLDTAKVNNELPELLLQENVKNLVSKKFKPVFNMWLDKLEALGYNNYWQVLNAKDYGVPQNRERVFVISIRKDIDRRGYNFPEKMLLTKALRDVLEENVDEKFYLSDKAVAGLLKHNENHLNKGTGFLWKPRDLDSWASCLRANGALAPTDNTIAEVTSTIKPKCAGNSKITDVAIGASRGRNPENPSDRTIGSPTEQRLEINKQGVSNTLTTVQKDNLVVEKIIQVGNLKEDKNFKNPQTGRVYSSEGLSPTLSTMQGGGQQPKIIIDDTQQGFNGTRIYTAYAPTLRAERHGLKTVEDVRIRRLTPRECWRLMDFSDEDFNKAQASGLSNTQLYKIAGNSIVVSCLYHVFRKLFIDYSKD